MTCGIDEAGRGTLAGDMVVAGVILHQELSGLKDSKALSFAQRIALRDLIKANSSYKLCVFSAAEIDNKGLSLCIKQALQEIAQSLKATRYIFDGNTNYGVSQITSLVKADKTIKEVQAASILAKTEKDTRLLTMAKDYPNYNFASHQGYATKAHIKEIQEFGRSEIHRKTFKLKALNET